MILNILKWAMLLSVANTSINVYKQGWLDRVVQYHKRKFIDDVQRLPPVQIKARLDVAPKGFVDSKDWDYDSVMRLLTLMRESEESRPVYKQLRRMLQPTRRILMSRNASYHLFPNIDPDNYYESSEEDFEKEEASFSDELSEEVKKKKKKKKPSKKPGKDDDRAIVNAGISIESGESSERDEEDEIIVYISNAVESRLPSKSITLKCLRGIMQNRAEAIRIMPSTSPSTILWIPMNRTTPHAAAPDGSADPKSPAAGGEPAKEGGDAKGTPGEETGSSTDAAPDAGSVAPNDASSDAPTDAPTDASVDPDGNNGRLRENDNYESDEYEEEKTTRKKRKRKLTTTARKKNKKGAKKIKRRRQAVKYGRKRKVLKVMVPEADRLFPFRAKNRGPRPLKESHPLRNGLAGGYYENYQRIKYSEPPHKKIKKHNLDDK